MNVKSKRLTKGKFSDSKVTLRGHIEHHEDKCYIVASPDYSHTRKYKDKASAVKQVILEGGVMGVLGHDPGPVPSGDNPDLPFM